MRKGNNRSGESAWQLNLVHELHHENGFGKATKLEEITALFVSGPQRTLYTGTSRGNVWNWTLPDNGAGDARKQSIWGT